MDPPLCANGCGFYGSATNKNLCSKCYKDYLKEIVTKSEDDGLKGSNKNLNDEAFNVVESSSTSKSCDSGRPNITDDVCTVAMDNVSLTDSRSMNNKNKRCNSCNKKVGLTGFDCRCGNVFCGRHRYPEEHACKVDFKESSHQALTKNNPLCIRDKLEHRI